MLSSLCREGGNLETDRRKNVVFLSPSPWLMTQWTPGYKSKDQTQRGDKKRGVDETDEVEGEDLVSDTTVW